MDKYLIALSYLDNLGPITLQKILEKLKPQEAWNASFFDLQKIGLAEKISRSLIEQRQKIDPDKIVSQIAKEQIQIISIFDDDYPKLLKEIYAPPVIIYYRGDLTVLNNQTSLAVVGSRKISGYAKLIMPDLLNSLIKNGVIIISGLAHGVDALAHRLAIEQSRPTIAILGSGLAWDYFYPKSNKWLAQDIIKRGGVIVSEFPPFTAAQPFNFPRRNRIISGLSKATLIIEASAKSGALITANYALEQNREVLVVPANINQINASGSNELIKKGAKVVTGSADIFEALNLYYQAESRPEIDYQTATEAEKIILKILSSSPLQIDKIIQHCTLETSAVNAALVQMEMRGWIKNLGGQNYIKC